MLQDELRLHEDLRRLRHAGEARVHLRGGPPRGLERGYPMLHCEGSGKFVKGAKVRKSCKRLSLKIFLSARSKFPGNWVVFEEPASTQPKTPPQNISVLPTSCFDLDWIPYFAHRYLLLRQGLQPLGEELRPPRPLQRQVVDRPSPLERRKGGLRPAALHQKTFAD